MIGKSTPYYRLVALRSRHGIRVALNDNDFKVIDRVDGIDEAVRTINSSKRILESIKEVVGRPAIDITFVLIEGKNEYICTIDIEDYETLYVKEVDDEA